MAEGRDDGKRNQNLGFGIAIGIAIGTAIGVALGNIAIGIAIGVALGVAFGYLDWDLSGKKKDSGPDGPNPDGPSPDGPNADGPNPGGPDPDGSNPGGQDDATPHPPHRPHENSGDVRPIGFPGRFRAGCGWILLRFRQVIVRQGCR